MVSNRRSRTDCDTYEDLPRDLTNAAPVPQKPVLPLIESADPHALFSWARNLNLSLDEWFNLVNSVLNDSSSSITNLSDCYCILVCDQQILQSCTAADDYIALASNQLAWDYMSRNYVEDLVLGTPETGDSFKSTGYHSRAKNSSYYTPPVIVSTSTNVVLDQTTRSVANPVDFCDEVTREVLDFRGVPSPADYINAGVGVFNLFRGLGDSITIGGLFLTPQGGTGRRTIFAFGSNNAGGDPNPPEGIDWTINYSTNSGTIQYQVGNEFDASALVRAEVQDDRLKSTGNEWKHITVNLSRTDGAVNMLVYLDGVVMGSAYVTKLVDDVTLLSDWGGHQLDEVADNEFERFIAFCWGGSGAREGWNDVALWTYFNQGGKSALQIAALHETAIAPIFTNYVDTEGFDPQVGDVLVVQQILEDGTVVWCNEPKFTNAGDDGDVLYQGPLGPEDVYFAPPPFGLPPGGLDQQIVRKDGDVDGEVVWATETRYVKTWESENDPANTETVVAGDLWVKGAA